MKVDKNGIETKEFVYVGSDGKQVCRMTIEEALKIRDYLNEAFPIKEEKKPE